MNIDITRSINIDVDIDIEIDVLVDVVALDTDLLVDLSGNVREI